MLTDCWVIGTVMVILHFKHLAGTLIPSNSYLVSGGRTYIQQPVQAETAVCWWYLTLAGGKHMKTQRFCQFSNIQDLLLLPFHTDGILINFT